MPSAFCPAHAALRCASWHRHSSLEDTMTSLSELETETRNDGRLLEDQRGRPELRMWHTPGDSRTNVGTSERLASVAAGSLAALLGLSRGTLPGLVCAAVGGALIYRGASGHCH